MLSRLKQAIKATPLAVPFILAKGMVSRPATQNEEGRILANLLSRYPAPPLFVEFGFSGWEFNCAPLVDSWEGLLIDGDPYNVTIARTILPARIEAKQIWLTLETLSAVRDWVGNRELGILSVDVDGNDYWFLNTLIDLKPAIVITEYNSSFGLHPVTVPYDPAFDRTKYHPEWLYYGASLPALAGLMKRSGYSLVAGTSNGVNAFFVRSDLGPTSLSAESVYRESSYPGSLPVSERWKTLQGYPLVPVPAP